MPMPTAYSEAQLAEFMERALGTTDGSVGNDLGPNVAPELSEAVMDVLARYGVLTVAEATNIVKLQAIARARVWVWAVDQYVTRFRISTDGQSLDRHALFEHAKERAEYWQGQVAIASSLTAGSTTARRPTMFAVAPGCRGR